MLEIDFDIDVSGHQAKLENFVRGLDLHTNEAEILNIVNDANKDQVISEGSRSGNPYAPLALVTQLERRALGYGAEGPILQRTGKFLSDVSSGNSNVSPDGKQMEIVVNRKTAAMSPAQSQVGFRNQFGKFTPARPVVDLLQRDADEIAETILRRATK